LEGQLQLVQSKLKSFDSDGKVLQKISELAAQMNERGITNNDHTSLTEKDIQVQWDQYKLFLQNKEKQIQDEIELARLRGLTPEDVKEIDDNFRQFDKNNNNYLETRELKTCLFSLGEERSKANIEELVNKFGDGKKLMYEQFFELMVQVLGDSDTLDEVINGFKLINRIPEGQQPIASSQKLAKVMEEPFIQYILEHGEKLGDGVDFVKWSQWIFSR
jgi:Ca2+-binding EF-hand superfamily protein